MRQGIPVPRGIRTVGAALTALAAVTAFLAAARPAVADPAAPAADASGQRWHVAATLGLSPSQDAISCPTATACTAAAGGELLTTADGGATWTRTTQALPTDLTAVLDLDCPSVSSCALLVRRTDGSTAVLVGPGAGPFTVLPTPVLGAATGISCPGVAHCLVTDGQHVWTTRDRGTTWRYSTLPRFAYSDQQITCLRATNRCVVFGNAGFTPVVDVTGDDGRTWTQQDPGAFDGLYGLACASATVCYAGGRVSGSAVLRRTTDGGATWKPMSTPGQPYGVRAIACASETSCTAFGLTPGDAPYAWSTVDGTHWTAQALPGTATTTPSPAVACPGVGRCRAAGGGVAYATDDGTTWTDHALPAVPEVPRAISCSTVRTCVTVGVDGVHRPLALTSTDAGTTWTPHPLPADLGFAAALDCVTGTRTCVAVGQYTPAAGGATVIRAAVSTDLGTTWQLGLPSDRPTALTSVSCPTTTTCLAAGSGRREAPVLWRTTDGARTWTSLRLPAGLVTANGVACTGPTSCVVLSDPYRAAPQAFTTSDLGASWQAHPLPTDPDDATDYYGFDCAASLCVAAGALYGEGALATSDDGGVSWTPVAPIAAAQLYSAVSCTSATWCAATSFDFRPGGGAVAVGTRDGGASWTVHRFETGRQAGGPLACAGTRCYAPQLSTDGNAVIVSGAP